MVNPSSPPTNGVMIHRGSFSGTAANERQSPKNGSAIEKLFHDLAISPRKSITPTRSRSNTLLAASTAPAEPLSPLQLFYHYLSTLFKGITATLQNERLCISFDPQLINCVQSPVPCIQARSQALLVKYPVELEISLEALFSKESRFGQFLEEIAPYLVSLTFFKTSACQKCDSKSCEKWLFPKLERLDLSRCSLPSKMFESLDCPKLQELVLRRVKGLSLQDIIDLSKKSPNFLNIDFKKCPEITSEQIVEALNVEGTNLLFFLRSATKYHHRALLDACRKKLADLFGDAASYDASHDGLSITLTVAKLKLEKLELLFAQEKKAQATLVLDYDKKEDPHTKACLAAVNAMKVECKTTLRLQQCEDLSSEKLAHLPDVTELKLPEKAALSREYFAHIAKMLPKLRCLDVSDCQNIEEVSFLAFLQDMPHLVAISLQNCKWLNEKFLMKLFDACPKLTNVDVRGCERVSAILQTSSLRSDMLDNELRVDWRKKMSDQSVTIIAQAAARAASLVFENCEIMTLAEPTAIFTKIAAQGNSLHLQGITIRDFVVDATSLLLPVNSAGPKIRKLKLEGPVGFSSFAQLLVFQQLTSLSIKNDEARLKESKASLINDGSLKMLPEKQGQLAKVTFEGFSEITEDSLGNIIANCKRLRSLRIKECPRVNGETLAELCSKAGVDLQYSVSPYHITIRQVTEEDRTEARLAIEEKIEKFQVILKDSFIASTENMEETLKEIETTQKTLQEKSQAEKEKGIILKDTMAKIAGEQCPSNEDLLKLADCANGIVSLRKDLQTLDDAYVSLKDTYQQGKEIREITTRKQAFALKELDSLSLKCAIMTVTTDSSKSLRSFEKLLEKQAPLPDPTVLRIQEQLNESGSREGSITLKFLLTSQELNTLSALGIIKKWVSSSLEF